VSYLTCPSCGLTVFDRNPLVSPRHCPRCRKRGQTAELERVATLRGGATASVLDRQQPEPVDDAEQKRGDGAPETASPEGI
jgi:hypothetical protein